MGSDRFGSSAAPSLGSGLALSAVTWRDLVVAGVLGALLAAVPLLWNAHAYYQDDMQAQYMPTFFAIGKSLRETGAVPFLTAQTWYGGNIIGEYQFAIFNPVALLLFYALPSFGTLAAGATFLAVATNAIWAAGVWFLARCLGISRPLSLVAAVGVVTNNFVFYWLASSWFPGFFSMAFLVWAMAFVLKSHEGKWYFLGAALATALTATAGWPHALIALAMFVGVRCVLQLSGGHRREVPFAILPVVLGVLLAAPAILPMLSLGAVSARGFSLMNGGFLVPSLGDAINFANPFHSGRMLSWSGYVNSMIPIYATAWFALPVLLLVNWPRAQDLDDKVRLLVAFSFLMLLLSQGPQILGPLRWPFRFLPYMQLGLVLLPLLALTKFGFANVDRWRRALLFNWLFVSALLSIQSNPSVVVVSCAAMSLIAFFSMVVSWIGKPPAVAVTFMMVTLLFTALTRAEFPRNDNIPDWHFYQDTSKIAALNEVPESYEFFLTGFGDTNDPGRFSEMLFGQMPLALGRPGINGYSPIGHGVLRDRFCFTIHGTTCPDAGPRLFEIEPVTGQSYADLMRVGRIIAERGSQLDTLRSAIKAPWQVDVEGQRTVSFARPLPSAALPGLLSWPVEGLEAELVAPPRSGLEELRITGRTTGVDTLVFARPWWPGYRAEFNGKPVPVRPLGGFLVSVVLPDDASAGDLKLAYEPQGLVTGEMLAGIGGLLLIVMVAAFGPLAQLGTAMRES